jgi:hypothetical protein
VSDTQIFEARTWADAEITPGPVRLAMEEAERKKAEADQEAGQAPDDKESEEQK